MTGTSTFPIINVLTPQIIKSKYKNCAECCEQNEFEISGKYFFK